ncbi:hypothetical protein Tco_1259219 [Tanacetum coccineum]
MEQFKINQLEANLERFKIDQAAINSEAAKQRDLLPAMIEKNKKIVRRQSSVASNVRWKGRHLDFLGALVTSSKVADGIWRRKNTTTKQHEQLLLKNLYSEDIVVHALGSGNQKTIPESRNTIRKEINQRVPEKNVAPPMGGDTKKKNNGNPWIISHQQEGNWKNSCSKHFELLDDDMPIREKSTSKEGYVAEFTFVYNLSTAFDYGLCYLFQFTIINCGLYLIWRYQSIHDFNELTDPLFLFERLGTLLATILVVSLASTSGLH